MTRGMRWIACLFTVLGELAGRGCAARPPAPVPAAGQESVRNTSPKISATELQTLIAEERLATDIRPAAATALEALERDSEELSAALRSIAIAKGVVLSNLANTDTVAFKATRTLMHGGGRLTTRRDMSGGNLQSTNRALDVGIAGDGFIRVKLRAPGGSMTGYTRNGNLVVTAARELAVNIGEGAKLDPPINIGLHVGEVSIDPDGAVFVVKNGAIARSKVGQIVLYRFEDSEALIEEGGVFHETDRSGNAAAGTAGSDGMGRFAGGFLETSNVDMTSELLRLHFLNQWRSSLIRAAGIEVREK